MMKAQMKGISLMIILLMLGIDRTGGCFERNCNR